MFLRTYVDLDLPFEEAEASLLGAPEAWVPGLLRDTEGRGHELLPDGVRGRRAPDRPGGRDRPRDAASIRAAIRIPLTWRATRGGRMFPQLEGDLEVAALGPSRSQLSMDALYRPPLALVGRALDRALLHRVAEATIKDFMEHVAERIAAHRAAVG
jgi:hypothetical protein